MKRGLKTQLSATILVIVGLTVTIISFLANYFINRQFTEYIAGQQELKAQIITSSISRQYTPETKEWNLDYIHAIGMHSLYEGYIVKVYGQDNKTLWDAQAHDMNLCNQIMDEISERMRISYPQIHGEFTAENYPLMKDGQSIGYVSISYFGPFFLNENEFMFLRSLNIILIVVGFISLVVSVVVGHLMARRINRPILNTIEATKEISDGNYGVRIVDQCKIKEINLLTESINQLAVSLETLEKLRKQLTEDVAHELRTPITILQSYIEAMSEGVWDATPERLESCYDEVTRIGKLVGDLEKLARVEGDNLKLEKRKIDLYDIIDKTTSNFQGEVEAKSLQLHIQGSHTTLYADADRIRQVVVNLLSNAIKYSREGGSIVIGLFETKDTAGFYVEDNGIGIAKEELPYIFERFYRADKSRNRATGGSGIGLTIVKAIVEAHGGHVSAESKLEEGSRFRVTLPKE